MTFNSNHYDAIGVAMVEELFKEAEQIFPIKDEPNPKKPSLLKRLVRSVMGSERDVAHDNLARPCGEETASPKAI